MSTQAQPATTLCFPAPKEPKTSPARVQPIAPDYTLLEIDRELDLLSDRIQDELEETGAPSEDSIQLFQTLCDAHGEKVDRIGGFIRIMETRAAYCRNEAARLTARAKTAENKIEQTKTLVLYFLNSRGIARMEGRQFTLRSQKNSQDTLMVTDEKLIPLCLKRVDVRLSGETYATLLDTLPDERKMDLISAVVQIAPHNEAIKQALAAGEAVEGATVSRGHHLRVA